MIEAGPDTSDAEQAATTQQLKNHGRSATSLEKVDAKPGSLTPMPVKKAKQTRWQFGIRSRNPPLDAMYCIYRALQRLGAEWERPPTVRQSNQRNGEGVMIVPEVRHSTTTIALTMCRAPADLKLRYR